MCGGHHGWGSAPSCCCDCGGHPQHGSGCGCHAQSGCGCGGHSQHGCGCGGGHFERGSSGEHALRFHRRFRSRDDEMADLEQYLRDLEAEAKGVRERLAELHAS
jgi:hypothetical protein